MGMFMMTSQTINEENPLMNALRIVHRKLKWVLILFCVLSLIGVWRIEREPSKIEMTARYQVIPHVFMNEGTPYPPAVFSDADFNSLTTLLTNEIVIGKVCKSSRIPRNDISVNCMSNPQERIATVSVTAPSEGAAKRWLETMPKVFSNVVAHAVRSECARELGVLGRRERKVKSRMDILAHRHESLSQQSGDAEKLQPGSGDSNSWEMNSRFLRERMLSARQEHKTLVALLGNEQPYKTILEKEDNPEYLALKQRIKESKRERASLLILYKPEHVRIQQLDASIATMERELSELSPYEIQSKKADNLQYQYLRERELEKRFELARLTRESLSVADMNGKRTGFLRKRRSIAGDLKNVETDLSAYQEEDLRLQRAISAIELYGEPLRTYLKSVSQGPEVTSSSPHLFREGLGVIFLSALFSAMIILTIEKWFHRVDTPEEAMRLLHVNECVIIPRYFGSSYESVNGFRQLYDKVLNRIGGGCSKGASDFELNFISWNRKSGKSYVAERLCQVLNDHGYNAVVETNSGSHIKTERFQTKRMDAVRSIRPNVSYILREGGNLETIWRNNEIPEWSDLICFVVSHSRNTSGDLMRSCSMLNSLPPDRLILIYNRASMT
jgi:hypothetical protein